MMRPVLILGDAPRVVLTVARSLSRHGVPVVVASLSPGNPPLRSNAIRRSVDLSPTQIPDALISLIQEEGCDMLIPVSDTAMSIVSRYRTQLDPIIHVACPQPEVAERVLDKTVTLMAAQRVGIPIPETWEIRSAAELDSLKDCIRFPLIAKPRGKHNIQQRGVFKIRYLPSFDSLAGSIAENPDFGIENLIQRYYPGYGIGIAVLMHDKQPITVFQHRRLKEYPSAGGVSVLASAETPDAKLSAQAISLLRELEWDGIAMVEFRYDPESNSVVLMEINGRYWGACSLTRHAGLEIPYYHWQIVHGQTPRIPAYRTGVKMRWLAGDIERMCELFSPALSDGITRPSAWREFFRFWADFNPATKGAVFSWQDWRPGWDEVRRTAWRIAKTAMKASIQRIAPAKLLEVVRASRKLPQSARRLYFRAQARQLRKPKPLQIPARVRSVLFVCHGNIIRSAMAGVLLRKHLDGCGVRVLSAGVHAEVGLPADERARQIAPEFGVSLEDHRPQALTAELLEESDLILIMDCLNEARLLARFPQASGKLFLLASCFEGPPPPYVEILDPNTGSLEDVRSCCRVLAKHVEALANMIRTGANNGVSLQAE